jgi:hypothetical protein
MDPRCVSVPGRVRRAGLYPRKSFEDPDVVVVSPVIPNCSVSA